MIMQTTLIWSILISLLASVYRTIKLDMDCKMPLELAVEVFATVMALPSFAPTCFVHAGFDRPTLFGGAKLLQKTFTGFYAAAIIVCKVSGLQPATETGC